VTGPWLPARVVAFLAAFVLAGCDGPPLGGSPPRLPARAGWSAPCPRLEGVYDLADRASPSGGRPWDELSIEAGEDGALRFTWRYADRPDPSVILRMAPDQLVRQRWTIGQDDRADDDFLQNMLDRQGLLGVADSQLVARGLMRCEHGWLAVPYAPGVGGMPNWPAGFNRNAQFTVDAQGALVADFSVHVAGHGFFSPSRLWCGRACRDVLAGGHDEHAWLRAPRKLGVAATSLDAPYEHGLDVMGSAPVAGEAVRERWRDRLPGLRATLARVRVGDGRVELTFAANDRASLAAATAAMRRLPGLHGVVVRRFSGGSASPQSLVITADADAALLAAPSR